MRTQLQAISLKILVRGVLCQVESLTDPRQYEAMSK